MRKILLILVATSLLAGCADRLTEVKVPVGVGCPEIKIAEAGEMRRLPIEDITDKTPIDVASRWWKASLYLALTHNLLLTQEKDSYKKAYTSCTKIPKGDSLAPTDVAPQ